jgi:hypothetical protein
MTQAKREPTRPRARLRVGKANYPEQLRAGGVQVPPFSLLEMIRRALRHAELSISLQPPAPYARGVLALMDEARTPIRALEQAADRVAGQRMAAAHIDQVVREPLVPGITIG